jgi:tetratricopeptide (TPR) repeat protein
MRKKYSLSMLAAISVTMSALIPLHVFAAESKGNTKETVPPRPTTKKVGDALTAAITAIDAKKFDVAAEKIKAAEAVTTSTDFDKFQTNEVKAYLYSKQDINPNEVLALYEQSLKTPGFFKEQGYNQRIRQLVNVTYKNKLYSKTIEYSKLALEDQPEDKIMLNVLGQVQYLDKQYPDCGKTMEKLVTVTESGGAKPDEQALQIWSFCLGQEDNVAGVAAVNEKLALNYPKDEYWLRLLGYYDTLGRSDPVLLQMYRLRKDLKLLTKAEYIDYAQLALDSAMPGEAMTVLQDGFDTKVLGVDAKDKAQYESVLTTAKQASTSDKAQIASYEKDAAKPSSNGRAIAGLGLAYFNFEMYDKAIEALDNGLEKGGLKDPQNYAMTLGVALYKHGDKERARAEFEKIAAGKTPQVYAAKAWAIRTRN